MRYTTLLLYVAFMLLAGCTSLPRNSGFEVRQVEAEGPQDPWQHRAIRRDVFASEGVALVYVRLPQPLPNYWRQELVDTARVYETSEEAGRKVRRPLIREVFRAIVMGRGATQTYDAVVDRDGRGFLVFAPLTVADVLPGQSLLILSSDGKWGMTSLGQRVEFPPGFDPKGLPGDFFVQYPAPITQVIRLEPEKDEYARRILDGLAQSFPQRFWLRGKDEAYAGKPDVLDVLGAFTSLEGAIDKLLSCTSLKIGPSTAAAAPLVATLYGIQAVRALTAEDCLK